MEVSGWRLALAIDPGTIFFVITDAADQPSIPTPTTFSFPTTTVFAAGVRRELGGRLAKVGSARPLVVTDASLTIEHWAAIGQFDACCQHSKHGA